MARLNLIQTGGGGVSGTLPISIAEVAHNWLDSYSSITGLFTQSRPAAADLSDTATSGNVLRGNGTSFVSAQLGYADLGGLPTLAVTTSRTAHSFFTTYNAGTGAFGQAQPAVADLSDTPAANFVLAGPTSGAAATATFRALVAADIPAPVSGTILWSALGNAGAALTLANAGYATTFNQTSAVNWTWANTTAASAYVPAIALVGTPGVASAHTVGTYTMNTVGATLLVAVLVGYSANPTISDSQANTWNYTTPTQGSLAQTRVAYAYSKGAGALATNTADVFTVGGGSGDTCAFIYAFSGTQAYPTNPFNTNSGAGADNLSSPISGASLAPSPGDVVICGLGNNGQSTSGVTITAGWSTPLVQANGASDETGAASYIIATSSATQNPTWTKSGLTICNEVMAAFHAASSTNTNALSPLLDLSGTYWNGSASAVDTWSIQDVVGTGTNPPTTLTFSHSGSSGPAGVQFPLLLLGSSATGLSQISAGIVGVGNGAAGDYSAITRASVFQVGGSTTGMSQVSSGILGVGNGSVGDFSATLQATSVSLAQGSAASPSLFFTGFTTGLYSSNSHAGITYVNSSTNYFSVVQGSATVPSTGTFAFSSTADSTHAGDSGISRLGAASLAVGNGTAGDKTGSITLANLILSATQSPASNAAGTAGQLAYDGSYIYICIASGNWRRVATTGGY